MTKAWVTAIEVKLARHVVCKAHGVDPVTAEKYLDHITGSFLQRYDFERKMYLTNEAGARLIRQLASAHGYAMLKAYEAEHGVPDDIHALPWRLTVQGS